jgi:hypothetical protein
MGTDTKRKEALMVIVSCIRSKVVLGLLVAVSIFAGSLVQSTEASAGFGSSPGRGARTSALVKNCVTGDHIKEITIEF